MGRKLGPTRRGALAGAAGGAVAVSTATAAAASADQPLVIAAQGSYAAGGTVYQAPGVFDPHPFICTTGGTNHGDHAYVRYQRPVRPRALPLVMWHGGGQFMRTWESTPDGREGYDSIFLRRDWEVHLLDQPRRGGAANSNSPTPLTLQLGGSDQSLWHIFRLGVYPDHFPGSQFPKGAEALNQYCRQRLVDIGSDLEVSVAGVSAVFDRIGPGILISHSAGGAPSFATAARNPKVRAVVSYEPGTIVVPEGYQPRPLDPPDPVMQASIRPQVIPEAQFQQLTRIPIQIVFGDNLPTEPSPYMGLEFWRYVHARSVEFCELINSRGGDAAVLDLPKVGVMGNTHFPFSDLNSLAVADKLSDYLRSKGLDHYA